MCTECAPSSSGFCFSFFFSFIGISQRRCDSLPSLVFLALLLYRRQEHRSYSLNFNGMIFGKETHSHTLTQTLSRSLTKNFSCFVRLINVMKANFTKHNLDSNNLLRITLKISSLFLRMIWMHYAIYIQLGNPPND